jgi:protein-disulfide isomerase
MDKRLTLAGVLFAVIFAFQASWAKAPEAAKPEQPIAVVAGQPIYEEDLAPSIQGALRQLQAQEFELKKNALDKLIEQRLLEAAAKKHGVTVEKLLAQEVDAKIGEPTDAEVQAYYLGLRGRENRPFDQVKAQLRASLKQQELQQAREEYLKQLRQKAGVTIYLNPPRVEVGYDLARLRGSAQAPVTIVEFSDFQCPFCRREEAVLKGLLSEYDGKLSLAYRDFPLQQIHPHAEMAAEAARCAGAQGKFWPYHDLLFTDPPQLDQPDLLKDAKSLGLDESKFGSCLSSHQFQPQVEADAQAASRLGVDGTPTFFINGVFLSGAQPASAFETIIAAELARKAPSNAKLPTAPPPHH